MKFFALFSIVALSTAESAGGSSHESAFGLKPGENSRLNFATSSTTNAMPSDIQDNYDSMNSNAKVATFNGSVISWLATGLTDTPNDVDDFGMDAVSGVCLTSGTKIATSTDVTLGRLWSRILIFLPVLGINRTPYENVNTWAGADMFGTEYAEFGNAFEPGSTNTIVGDFPDPQAEVGLVSLSSNRDDSVKIGDDVRSFSDQFHRFGISELLSVYPEPTTILASGFGIIVLAVSSTSVNAILYGSRSKRRMAIKVFARCIGKIKAHRHAKL